MGNAPGGALGGTGASAESASGNHSNTNPRSTLSGDMVSDVAGLFAQFTLDGFLFDREFDILAALFAERLLSNQEGLPPRRHSRYGLSWREEATGAPGLEGDVFLHLQQRQDSEPMLLRSLPESIIRRSNSTYRNSDVVGDSLLGELHQEQHGGRLTQSLPPAPHLRGSKGQHHLPSLKTVLRATAPAFAPASPHGTSSRPPHPGGHFCFTAVSLSNSGTSLTDEGPTSPNTAAGPFSRLSVGGGVQAGEGGWPASSRPSSSSSRTVPPAHRASMFADGNTSSAARTPVSPALRSAIMDLEYVGLRRLMDAVAYVLSGESRGKRSQAVTEAFPSLASGSASMAIASSAGAGGANGGGGHRVSLSHGYNSGCSNSLSRHSGSGAAGVTAAAHGLIQTSFASSSATTAAGGVAVFSLPEQGSANNALAAECRPQHLPRALLLTPSQLTLPSQKHPHRVSASSFGEQSYNNALLVSMNARSNVSLTTSSAAIGSSVNRENSSGYPLSHSMSRSEAFPLRPSTPSTLNMLLSPQCSCIPQPPQSGVSDRRSTQSYLRRGYHHYQGTVIPPALSGFNDTAAAAALSVNNAVDAGPSAEESSTERKAMMTPGFASIGLWSGSGSLQAEELTCGHGAGGSSSFLVSKLSGSLSFAVPSVRDPTDDGGAGLAGLSREYVLQSLCNLFAHLHLSKQDVSEFFVVFMETLLDAQELVDAVVAAEEEAAAAFAALRNGNCVDAGPTVSQSTDGGVGLPPRARAAVQPYWRSRVAEFVERYFLPPLSAAKRALLLVSRPDQMSTLANECSQTLPSQAATTAARLHPSLQPVPQNPGTATESGCGGARPPPVGGGGRLSGPSLPSAAGGDNDGVHTHQRNADGGGSSSNGGSGNTTHAEASVGGRPALVSPSPLPDLVDAVTRSTVNDYFRERSTLLGTARGNGSTSPVSTATRQRAPLCPNGGTGQVHGHPQQPQPQANPGKNGASRGQPQPLVSSSIGSSSPRSAHSTSVAANANVNVNTAFADAAVGEAAGRATAEGRFGVGSGRALSDLLVQKNAFVFHYAEQLVYQIGSDILLAADAGSSSGNGSGGGGGLAPSPPAQAGAGSAGPGFRQQQYANGINPTRSPSVVGGSPSLAVPAQTTYATTTLWPLRTRMVSLCRHYLYVYDALASTYAMMGGAWHQRLAQAAGGESDLHTPIALCDMARAFGSDVCILSGPTDAEVLSVHPSRHVRRDEQVKYLQDAADLCASFANRNGCPPAATAGGDQAMCPPPFSLDGSKGASGPGGGGGGGPLTPVVFPGSSSSDVEVHRVENRERRVFLLTLPGTPLSSGDDTAAIAAAAGGGGTHEGSEPPPPPPQQQQQKQQRFSQPSDRGNNTSVNSEAMSAGFEANRILRPAVLSLQGCAGHATRTTPDTGHEFSVVSGADPVDLPVYPIRFLCNNVVHHLFFQNPSVRAQWYHRLCALVIMNQSCEHVHKVAATSVDCSAFIRHRVAYPVGPSAFECVDMLGAGAFGRVLLVRHKLCGKLFAMKVVRKTGFHSMRNIVEIRRECTILPMLDCPYTMKLHATFQTDSRVYMLLDYLPGGELLIHTQKAHHHRFDEPTARFYIAQLAIAIEHLRMRGITHRDVKGDNLVLDEDGNLVLTDFGFAKKITVDDELFPAQGNNPPGRVVAQSTSCGTRAYIAPEVLSLARKSEGYGLEVDWWSMGVVLFTLLTGFFPFLRQTEQETNQAIISGPLQFPLKSTLSEAAKDLLGALLQKNPQQRISCLATLKKHAFFHGFDWAACERRQMRAPIQLHRDLYARLSSSNSSMRRQKEGIRNAFLLNYYRGEGEGGGMTPHHLRSSRTRASGPAKPPLPSSPSCLCAPTPPINPRYTTEFAEEREGMSLAEAAYGLDVMPFPTQPENDVLSSFYEQQERSGSMRDLNEILSNNLLALADAPSYLVETAYGGTARTHLSSSGGTAANGQGASASHPEGNVGADNPNYIPIFLPLLPQAAFMTHVFQQQQQQQQPQPHAYHHGRVNPVCSSISLTTSSTYRVSGNDNEYNNSLSYPGSALTVSSSAYFDVVADDFNEAAYDTLSDRQHSPLAMRGQQ